MKIAFHSDLEKVEPAPLLVLPVWESLEEAADFGRWKKSVALVLKSGDFKGRNGETYALYPEGEKKGRLLLLGLGKQKEATEETLRRAYSSAVRFAQNKKIDRMSVVFPIASKLEKKELLRGIFEGIALTNYAYGKLKHDALKDNPIVLLEQVGLVGVNRSEAIYLERLEAIVSSVFLVRDLVNGNADDKLSVILHEVIPALKKGSAKLKVELFDKRKLEEEKMGLILAVSRGSVVDPCLIQVSYQGNPKSKEHIVLVGKGITYDTGGLSIKPTDGMLTMKCDMAGAATVLAAVRTAAELGLKVNVTALAPMAENGIDGKSYKLGDVYRSYSGRTVEINNTDAEGRLVLADALSYAVKNLKPTCMIDLATLTGAAVVALGDDISALFSKDEGLAKELLAASKVTGEPVWQLPLVAEYKEAFKSEIADTLNSGGREAGAIKAALFLQEFVSDVSWAHLDIAGPAYLNKPKHYNTTKATGYGVRLLVEFLEKRSAS